MRAVVQRVQSANVTVASEVVASMGAGLLALVGVGHADTEDTAETLASKLAHLRIFEDETGRMSRSLLDTGGTLGVVSQFTLFGDVRKGRRPSFSAAAPADLAAPLLVTLAEASRRLGLDVVTGRFQTHMEVSLVNRGPVTLLIDTDGAV